jgi:hypothetical protein
MKLRRQLKVRQSDSDEGGKEPTSSDSETTTSEDSSLDEEFLKQLSELSEEEQEEFLEILASLFLESPEPSKNGEPEGETTGSSSEEGELRTPTAKTPSTLSRQNAKREAPYKSQSYTIEPSSYPATDMALEEISNDPESTEVGNPTL